MCIFVLNKTQKQTKMENNVIYLKSKSSKLYTALVAFNRNTLTRVSVSTGSFDFSNAYDSIDQVNDAIQRHLFEDYEICTREEFNAFYRMQSEELNHIIKEI